MATREDVVEAGDLAERADMLAGKAADQAEKLLEEIVEDNVCRRRESAKVERVVFPLFLV